MNFWYARIDYLQFLMNFSTRNGGKRLRTGGDRELVVGDDVEGITDGVPDVVDDMPDVVDGVPDVGMITRLMVSRLITSGLIVPF
jgi:hypothetical protein